MYAHWISRIEITKQPIQLKVINATTYKCKCMKLINSLGFDAFDCAFVLCLGYHTSCMCILPKHVIAEYVIIYILYKDI